MARMIVGLGDLAVSGEPGDLIVTHALGSCVALVVHDRAAGVCGLAHIVVAGEPREGETAKPAYHSGPGTRNLLDAVRALGGGRALHASLVGGALVVEALTADIGKRNVLAVRRALWAQGIVPVAEDVGGNLSRTVTLDVPTGTLRISNPTQGTWTLEQELR